MKRINFELGYVLRRAGGDCTNNGITNRNDLLFIFPENCEVSEIECFIERDLQIMKSHTFDERHQITKEKCFRIEKLSNGCTRAVPIFPRPSSEGTYMAGGNYVSSSDASFIRMVGHNYPVSVHDRFESWSTYEALSR